MFDYEKEYANLVGTIDFALTLLEKKGAESIDAVKLLLSNALLNAEEHYMSRRVAPRPTPPQGPDRQTQRNLRSS